MFSLEILIMVGVILFCVGGLVGAVISRTLIPPRGQRELEEHLSACRQELGNYQQNVAEHFVETSRLVNNLTQSYRDVHEHLAQGALELANAEVSQKMLNAAEGYGARRDDNALEELSFEPPRDWAPKRPGEAGTLSEEFGLNEVQDESGVESTTATKPRREQ